MTDIAVEVQKLLRRAAKFDVFLDALQDLIDKHRGQVIPMHAQRRHKVVYLHKAQKKKGGRRTEALRKGTKRRAVTAAETERIVRMRASNITFAQIATDLGRSGSAVRNAWHRAKGDK